MGWIVESNRIRFPESGAVVRFDFEIKETTEVGGVLILVLEVPPDQMMAENVFGIAKDGSRLWQIERNPDTATDPVNRYVGLSPIDDHTLSVANWNGFVVDVNARTGQITRSRWLK